jgi:hypothetical protein
VWAVVVRNERGLVDWSGLIRLFIGLIAGRKELSPRFVRMGQLV